MFASLVGGLVCLLLISANRLSSPQSKVSPDLQLILSSELIAASIASVVTVLIFSLLATVGSPPSSSLNILGRLAVALVVGVPVATQVLVNVLIAARYAGPTMLAPIDDPARPLLFILVVIGLSSYGFFLLRIRRQRNAA